MCQSLSGAACNFIKKETLAQVFSCEFCEISKNTFFTEHVWTTASLVWENQIKKLEKHNCPSFRKTYSTSRKSIGGHKKKEKNSKTKTTALTFLCNLKKKPEYQDGENWCYTDSFMSLAISNLRTTAICFGNIELLK